jgi:hypothetical protein
LYNIVGGQILQEYVASFQGREIGSDGDFETEDGHRIAYFKRISNLFTVQLRGPPSGPPLGSSYLQIGSSYRCPYVAWPVSERERFRKQQPAAASAAATVVEPKFTGLCPGDPSPAESQLSAEEMQWLKRKFGNELNFLRIYGLNITKDKAREEGRRILRTLIHAGDVEDEEFDDSGLVLRGHDGNENDEDGEFDNSGLLFRRT